MKRMSVALLLAAALALVVGTVLAFTHKLLILSSRGYWRGAVALVLFAIALELLAEKKK